MFHPNSELIMINSNEFDSIKVDSPSLNINSVPGVMQFESKDSSSGSLPS